MTDTPAVSTASEDVERLAKRLSSLPFDMTVAEFDAAAATLRALRDERDEARRQWANYEAVAKARHEQRDNVAAERDAARATAARLREAHAENARLLGLVANDLQGRVEAGKLMAIMQCQERAALAQKEGGHD